MDKLKYILFFAVILGLSLYPLIEVKNQPKPENYKNRKIIPTLINDGKYFIYEVNLSKKGAFERLEVFKSLIKAYKFSLRDLKKEETIISEKIIYKKPVLKGYNVLYTNKDYNITTDFAAYNQETKVLNGSKFKIFSTSYKGFGDSFMVDNEKNVFATNIKYFLKVEK